MWVIASPRQPAADPVRECLAELQRPLAHGLVADRDAARGQRLLDHPQAEREAEVEPDGVADDLRREAVAGVGGRDRRRHARPVAGSPPARNLPRANLTVPSGVFGQGNFVSYTWRTVQAGEPMGVKKMRLAAIMPDHRLLLDWRRELFSRNSIINA